MPARYHLTSEFRFTSPREAVWNRLLNLPEWPSWWRWSKRMDEVQPPSGDQRLGGAYRHRVGSPLGYGFSYTGTVARVDPLRLLELASTGDLEGTARFVLTDAVEGGTELSFVWLAHTPRWWMNIMAPIARPMFTWNHDKLMTDFGRGLAAATGGRLVTVSNAAVKPGSVGFFRMPS